MLLDIFDPKAAPRAIGIDLGTTNSIVAYVREGSPAALTTCDGTSLLPSVVHYASSGAVLVGRAAKAQLTREPERTIASVKRFMGRDASDPETERLGAYRFSQPRSGEEARSVRFDVGPRAVTPIEVSAEILKSLKQSAIDQLRAVGGAVITVPAYFDDAQRQATKDAGRLAGLEVLRLLNEPTAAALAYGLDKTEREVIAVYDLGGGTFDISILEIATGVFNVKATGGDTHLGGEDFDRAIIDKLSEEFLQKTKIDLRADRTSLQRLREAAEKAKHELSSSLETDVNLPFVAIGPAGPLHLERTLKRSELEIWTRELVERTIVACKAVLADAKMTPQQVGQVVLVGGMTRMPAVQKAVREFFGRDPNKGVNPDEVVAVGAAIQGAALAGQIDEVLLLDVTPLSIGVETGGGVFTKLIPRNTTVPTEKSEVFTTSVDNQSFVPVHVLQGEREMAVDNRSLARFELTGIPPAPRGLPKIQVTFRIDANGILAVEAKDMGTGRSQAVNVTPTSGLQADEIDKLVTEGEKFKETDQLRRDLAEMRNQAETLIYTTEQALDAYADLLEPEKLEKVRGEVQLLKKMLETGATLDALRGAYAQLENSTFEIAEAMYAS